MQAADRVNVFEYLDYRAFLRAHYEREKARGGTLSHRAFSRRAGIRSTNYLVGPMLLDRWDGRPKPDSLP